MKWPHLRQTGTSLAWLVEEISRTHRWWHRTIPFLHSTTLLHNRWQWPLTSNKTRATSTKCSILSKTKWWPSNQCISNFPSHPNWCNRRSHIPRTITHTQVTFRTWRAPRWTTMRGVTRTTLMLSSLPWTSPMVNLSNNFTRASSSLTTQWCSTNSSFSLQMVVVCANRERVPFLLSMTHHLTLVSRATKTSSRWTITSSSNNNNNNSTSRTTRFRTKWCNPIMVAMGSSTRISTWMPTKAVWVWTITLSRR